MGERAPNLSADEVAKLLDGWELIDAHGAVVLVKGAEAHVAAPLECRGKWLSRRVLREILAPIIAQFGHVETSVLHDNKAGHAFVQRLGFARTGETDSAVRYMLKEIKHA